MSGEASTINRMRVALDANAAAYRRAVQTSAPGDCWDYLVVTAANEKQATGYRQELALRHRAVGPAGSFFPAIQKSIVVPDPPGRRAGSGGATLAALRRLCDEFRLGVDELARARILMIHSGGASQRLPAYSPLGKIFAPLPLLRPDGQIATLFDHLYLTLAGLPERLGAGMLILAGDVFLLFDHRHVSAPAAGVTALTMRVEAELGRGHGVFVIGARGAIRQTLQKAPIEQMRRTGALDENGQVLIDTGLLFFDAPRTRLLAGLAGVEAGARSSGRVCGGLQDRYLPIDLYDDMTAALAEGTDQGEYIRGSEQRALRRELWKRLHGTPFQAMLLEGQFLHLGTTRQFRDAMVGRNPSPAAELFQQNVLVHSPRPLPPRSRVYHSVFPAGGRAPVIGEAALIEHSILSGECRIGAGCVVSQVLALRHPLRLPKGLLVFQVPIRRSPRAARGAQESGVLYVHVLCGVEDDFKGRFPDCSFLNEPIDRFLSRCGVTPREIWPETPAERRTLWTARLFPGTAERDSGAIPTWFASEKPEAKVIRRWRRGARFSMAQLLEQADPLAMIEHREVVAAYLQTQSLLDSIGRDEDQPVDSFIGHYSSPAAYHACLAQLTAFTGRGRAEGGCWRTALHRSRACWLGAQLLQRPDLPASDMRGRMEQLMGEAFAGIAQASEPVIGVAGGAAARPVRLKPGLRIEAASPVRLDLSGGWTDTPPYCYERGGHVVNVAINLDNQPPVRAMVRTIAQPVLILESNDLGSHADIRSLEQLRTRPNVHDPFALHKVALELVGLVPAAGSSVDLAGHLKSLGAGLIVSTECRVPKGSGLGTSSILGATLLAALHDLGSSGSGGGRPRIEDLISQTLLLEQRLSTGGGWQDQVGGIVGGLKSTVASPGIPQRPVVEALPLSDELYGAFEERLVVYYSGQQRLARDILRRVMGRWLAREPAVIQLMDQLRRSAAALRVALLKGRWPAVAREIARYWELKKQLYPGSTTPTIDVLFLELSEQYLAAGLAGAGGGGFAYFFCRDGRQAGRLRALLAARSARPGSLGSLYQTQINRRGLCITRRSS